MSREGILWGWAEIGEWLTQEMGGPAITRITLYKWERDRGMPVHRPDPERRRGTRVYAITGELLDWLKNDMALVE